MDEYWFDTDDIEWLTCFFCLETYYLKTINMNIFTACEVFFTFLEAKPCHVR